MSLTMSQGDGVTVITVTTNPKSKWPILCQILGTLCYSPVCSTSVAHNMKGKLKETLKALGIIQMIMGIINIAIGIFLVSIYFWYGSFIRDLQAAFWIGGVFLVVGIVCILAAKFPSPCVLVIAVILNIFSAMMAITAVVLYSMDLAANFSPYFYSYCDDNYYSRYGDPVTPSPERRKDQEMCLYYRHLCQVILRGVNIMMIVLAVLQLCVTISSCVVTLKALCKKSGDAQSVKDPQLYKPLLEDPTGNPAC